ASLRRQVTSWREKLGLPDPDDGNDLGHDHKPTRHFCQELYSLNNANRSPFPASGLPNVPILFGIVPKREQTACGADN
ncbi:MAG TPA: hypothetical protein VG488_01950, partial [Candidatus Angelobacter sp.]|nr:hypothetical protein [Candidatus Angelobacter sp.]